MSVVFALHLQACVVPCNLLGRDASWLGSALLRYTVILLWCEKGVSELTVKALREVFVG